MSCAHYIGIHSGVATFHLFRSVRKTTEFSFWCLQPEQLTGPGVCESINLQDSIRLSGISLAFKLCESAIKWSYNLQPKPTFKDKVKIAVVCYNVVSFQSLGYTIDAKKENGKQDSIQI